MDTEKIIKYVAIAAAVYLAWRYMSPGDDPSWVGLTPLPPTQPGTGAGTGSGPVPPPHPSGTGASAGTSSPPPPPQATPSPSAQPSAQANPVLLATNYEAAVADSGGNPPYSRTNTRYTVDEWNYFRSQGGKQIIDALSFPGIDSGNRSTARVTADQYWTGMIVINRGNPGALSLNGLGLGAFGQYAWLA